VVPVSPYDDYGIDIYDEKIEESILTMDELGEEIATIIELKSDEDGWINQSEIGIQLSKRLPGFDPRNYGYAKLGKLIQSFDFLETDAVPSSKNPKLSIVYVRIK
jgi:Fe-S-cluster formation regulator IscX/YfhJ